MIAPARVASECVEALTYPLVPVTSFSILRKRSKNPIASSAVYQGGWGGMRRCSPGGRRGSVQPGWEGGEAVCSLVAAAGGWEHGGGNMWCGGAGGWGAVTMRFSL